MNDSMRFLCACFLLLGIGMRLSADGANPPGAVDPDIARVEQDLLPNHMIGLVGRRMYEAKAAAKGRIGSEGGAADPSPENLANEGRG